MGANARLLAVLCCINIMIIMAPMAAAPAAAELQ